MEGKIKLKKKQTAAIDRMKLVGVVGAAAGQIEDAESRQAVQDYDALTQLSILAVMEGEGKQRRERYVQNFGKKIPGSGHNQKTDYIRECESSTLAGRQDGQALGYP